MNEKEKKAIEDLKELSHYCSIRMLDIEDKNSDTWANFVVDIQVIKNLIEKQDKIINEMANEIAQARNMFNFVNDTKEAVIDEYKKYIELLDVIFEKKVGE